MHTVTSSLFFPIFFSQPWISAQNKVRMLEWKGRFDLAIYASRRSPKLLIEEISNFGTPLSWKEVFDTCMEKEGNDGHVTKMARALANGEKLSKPYEGKEEFRIRGDMWLKLGNMREYLPLLCPGISNTATNANCTFSK
jgi:hypothetical protein